MLCSVDMRMYCAAREERCGLGDAVDLGPIRVPPTLGSRLSYAIRHLASPQKPLLISGRATFFSTRPAKFVARNLEGSEGHGVLRTRRTRCEP
jgi:hypothetical protein